MEKRFGSFMEDLLGVIVLLDLYKFAFKNSLWSTIIKVKHSNELSSLIS